MVGNMNHLLNGNFHNDSDNDNAPEDKIRVGRDFQAVVPELKTEKVADTDKALPVWKPTELIRDEQLDCYVIMAKERYGYNAEQALGMLYWHRYDLQRAINDLANFMPFPEEWTQEDKLVFEQAFLFNGKNFLKIRQSLPDKTMGMLVQYYYSWKKLKGRISLMDRQVKKAHHSHYVEDTIAPSENGTDVDTDSECEEKKWIINRGIQRETDSPPKQSVDESSVDNEAKEGLNNQCSNCGVTCTNLHSTYKGLMCKTCMIHYKKTGCARPTFGRMKGKSERYSVFEKRKRSLPHGMYMNHDDLMLIASQKPSHPDDLFLRDMERELCVLKRDVQNNKQQISTLKRKTTFGIDKYRLPDSSITNRIAARWTNDELLMAVQGIKKFGKDFAQIAEVLGTKTPAQIRTFYVNYRERYNLDEILAEHEAENNGFYDGNESDNDFLKSSTKSVDEDKKMDIVEEILSDSDNATEDQSAPSIAINNGNKAQTVAAK